MRFDFTRLKGLVSVADVLRVYRLDGEVRKERDELVGPCPLPGHGGDRSNRGAFRVNQAKGVYHCQSHCGGGDVVDLVMAVEGCSFAEAARVLDRLAGGRPPGSRPTPKPRSAPRQPSFRPFTRRIDLDHDDPYLRAKGITRATAAAFEAGRPLRSTYLAGCLAVRLHDPAGNPLGYTGRRRDWHAGAAFPKWRLPARFPKADVLFNWHRARTHVSAGLVVVEGPFDTMKVWQAGFPGVVALLGSCVSPAQAALLATAPSVVAMLDGDNAGRRGTRKLQAALAPLRVEVVGLLNGRDPADLADEELRRGLAPFFSSPCPSSS